LGTLDNPSGLDPDRIEFMMGEGFATDAGPVEKAWNSQENGYANWMASNCFSVGAPLVAHA
jgi:hypothetical protein